MTAWTGTKSPHYDVAKWTEPDRPCADRTIDYALRCATEHVAAHDDSSAVLAHGDVHQWNLLEAGDGFALVDPDGLIVEPEYDLGVMTRENTVELTAEGPGSVHMVSPVTAGLTYKPSGNGV